MDGFQGKFEVISDAVILFQLLQYNCSKNTVLDKTW